MSSRPSLLTSSAPSSPQCLHLPGWVLSTPHLAPLTLITHEAISSGLCLVLSAHSGFLPLGFLWSPAKMVLTSYCLLLQLSPYRGCQLGEPRWLVPCVLQSLDPGLSTAHIQSHQLPCGFEALLSRVPDWQQMAAHRILKLTAPWM